MVMFDIRVLPEGAHDVGTSFNPDAPIVIEGSEVFDTLCPVSKLTGFRENPLVLLSKVLDPAKARLIDAVLQEIPSVNEDGRISDDEALDMMVDRLATGTPAEDSIIRSKLSSMLDVLLPPQVRKEVEQRIEFEPGDLPGDPSDAKS